MTKKTPSESLGKSAEKPTKTPKKPKSAPAEKPVADRKEGTRCRVKEALSPKIPNFSETLSTKEGLKSIIRRYLRDCVKTPPEDLEETTNLTLQELSKQCDESGRSLDSIYWFAEGTFVQIKNGKLFAKKREGKKVQILISGKEIKVVKPEQKPAEEQVAPAEATIMPESGLVDLGFVYGAEVGVEGSEPAAVPEPAALAAPAVPAPEPEPAPQPPEPAKPAPLPPELISLLTKTNADLQDLRGEFDFFKTHPDTIILTSLGNRVKTLGDKLIALPDPQFQLDKVRLMRARIAELQVEIEELRARTETEEKSKQAAEMPSILKGLSDRIDILRQNANTWKTEVELFTGTSRVPTQKEVDQLLEKYNTLLLDESDKLRGQINDIEKSSVYNDGLKAKLDPLKEQISEISKGLEAPVRDLRDCLARLPATNGGQGKVVRLKTVRSGPTAAPKPVDATDVFTEPNSLLTRVLRFLRPKK